MRWGVTRPRREGSRKLLEEVKTRPKGNKLLVVDSDGGLPPTATASVPPPRRKTPFLRRPKLAAAAPNPTIAASAAAIRPRGRIPRHSRPPERGEMANSPGGSLVDGAAGSDTTTGGSSGDGINAPHLRSRQLPSSPTGRRSSRDASNPYRAHPPTRLGSEAAGSFDKKRKQPTAGDSAPLTPRDPNRTYGSNDGAKGRSSEHGMVGNARSSPKKRKHMSTTNYLSLFKPSSKWQSTDEVVRSKQTCIPTKSKKVKESPFQKLQRLPDGCHPDFDNDHLCAVNNLREFWHKSQGAVFVDDKENVMKTILFMLSVLPDACRPFLLVTTASLPLWETKFRDFAPCINVVIYAGEKDVHNLIQNPDSHENGGHTMHVLLAHPDAILEDIKNIESIGWEAVIVEYCQSLVLKHLEQLKQLPTDFRMVLLSSPLKDNIDEYKNLLAFLDSEQDCGDYIDAAALAMLKARFRRHIAYERKACSSNFLEYWVPAYLSQAQLKQYSSLLLEKSFILQSQTATDNVKALHDIVMSLWKCCNHPCLVGLQHSPVNTHDVTESADAIMHNSGKLLLLDKMLKEIRNKRLRVIVLFQSDGAIGDVMGNILENFVRHRFGSESYERVQNRSPYSTKQEAINMFNDTTKGRFVFLIDSRACHSSIKLSSVDTIIIYGSDLNPLNDLKALRKIKIDSQLKYVRIFRLYTPFTVEEKGLVLAKQNMIIDSNCQDIMPTLSHCLLSWGVSFLFSRVDELQQNNFASESCERGRVFMDKVISEFLTELSTDIQDCGKVNSQTISKVYMSGEFYSRNITLVGERDGVSSLDGDPPEFWLNLLSGKSRCQQYKHIEVSTEETNEARRKLRKTGEITGSSSKSSPVINNESNTPSSADLHLLPETGVESLSTPKRLHAELKLELSKLATVLKLPDNVHSVAKKFLEYLLKNHLVVREPPGILHAFNIALCWRAASFRKYTKLDHGESAALAANCLNYEYNEELTRVFYKKMRILGKKVGHKRGGRRNKIQAVTTKTTNLRNLRSDHIFPKQAVDLHGNFTNGTQDHQSASEQMVSDGQELVSAPEADRDCQLVSASEADRDCQLVSALEADRNCQLVPAPEADRDCHLSSEEFLGRTSMKRIKIEDLFNNNFCARQKAIMEKQQLEILNLKTQRDNQVMKLKEVCQAVVQHIQISDIDEEIRSVQKKLVIKWFAMLMLAFLVHMRLQLAKLEALQSATWVEEQLMKEKLKHEVLSGQLNLLLDLCDNLPDSSFVVEEFIHFKKQNVDNHADNILASGCDQLLGDRLVEITLVQNPVPSEAFSACAVRNEPAEAHTRSGGEAAPESLDLPDSNIHCNSNGVDPCCASAIPAIHDSTNQEPSTGDARNIEHAKRNNIVDPSMLPGSATSLVMGINAVAADLDHLESPILVSPQNHMTLEYPPAEAEPTDTLAAQDLQTGTQTSCLTLNAQHLGMRPDNSSKMNLELDTAAEVFLKGTTSNHLGDSSVVVKDKNADTVADPLNSEDRSYIAPHVPAVLPDALEVETQIDQSNMPAQHSTGLPAQQNTAVTGHRQAEPSSNLDTESAQSLQPDIQPSSLILDADSSQTGRQPETAPVLSQGGSTYHHLVDGRMGFDVDNNGMVCAHQAHKESPTFSAPQRAEMLPFSSDVGTHANLSSTSPLQSSDTPSSSPPAVAESPRMSGTQLEQDLLPDMAPSTSLSGVPLQRTLLDDSSQTGCQPDRATDLSKAGETEYLTSATCNLATLPASREAETENGQESVPAQEIRSLHSQHNLATSQPLVDDLQPPASILSEEAEMSRMLCSAAAQNSQHGMEPSVTTQDVRLERTDLSGMPVTLSTPVLQSVEPSRDPHTEQADTLGMLSAPNLRPEVQPSSPRQDQYAEVEGAGTSGTIVAQNMQPETQSSTSVQHNPPERAHPDERIQVDLQPSSTSGPVLFTQLVTVPPAAVNNLAHSSEPLINELETLKLWKAALSNDHEQKKSKLQAECNQELEKIVKKFELILQKEDQAYHQKEKYLDDAYRKVFLQQSLAENFGEKFMKSIPAQERSVRPTTQQAPQSSQQAALSWMSVAQTSLPVSSPLATWPLGLNSLYSTGSFLQPSHVPRASASEAVQPQPVLPASLYRGTPSPVSSMALRNGSYGRGPAPHLRQPRMPAPSSVACGDQQQLAAMSPGITSSRQSATGMLEGFASVSALAGIPLTPVASGSVQHARPSASSPLPGSAPELMANFLQSPSTIPVTIAGQQASGLIPGFHHVPGGSVNGMAGIAQAGGHLGGTNQAAPEPTWEALLLLQRQWAHAMAPSSSVQQTVASSMNPHPGFLASSANRYLMVAQQALIQNPAFGNVAGPASAAAGVWHRGAAQAVAANQPDAPGPSSSTVRAAGRTGP